tara:strand:+ start:774 stop:995 length:222 start_codon:yes stop_codon:yes gene_type:complete
VAHIFLRVFKPDIYGIILSRIKISRGFFDGFLQNLHHHPRKCIGVSLADHYLRQDMNHVAEGSGFVIAGQNVN